MPKYADLTHFYVILHEIFNQYISSAYIQKDVDLSPVGYLNVL